MSEHTTAAEWHAMAEGTKLPSATFAARACEMIALAEETWEPGGARKYDGALCYARGQIYGLLAIAAALHETR